mmetsp:Transcript_28844/g.47779  ORF Transcript_28844/g.47779 Transcript_28844/m.47779 type:complete len:215 (+) Transcript_28844:1014-1658(+)
MQHRQFEHLAKLLNLVFIAAYVVVRDVRLLLHRHHCHRRINLWRQWHLNLIFVSINAHPHALLDISRSNPITESDDELSDLFDVDHVLGVVSVWVYDLCAASNLQRLLLLHHLLVGNQIPLRGRCKSGIRLLYADNFIDLRVQILNVLVHCTDLSVVWSNAVSLQQSNVAFIKCSNHLLIVILGWVIHFNRHGASHCHGHTPRSARWVQCLERA